MKLIIDIPEKIEEYIKDYIPIGAGDNVFCYPDEIVRVIQNGIPIPDNATNEICGDSRFEIIAKAKEDIISSTQGRIRRGWKTEDILFKPIDKRYSHDKHTK